MQQVGNNNVVRHHAAGEDHRDEHDPLQKAAELELRAGKHIAHGGGQHNADDGAQHRDAHRHQQGLKDHAALVPQEFIRGQRELGRDQRIAVGAQRLFRRDGDHQNEEEGENADKREDGEHHVEDRVGRRFDLVQAEPGLGFFAFDAFFFALGSALFRHSGHNVQFLLSFR